MFFKRLRVRDILESTGRTTYHVVYWVKTAYKLNLIVPTIKLKCCVFCAVHTNTHTHVQRTHSRSSQLSPLFSSFFSLSSAWASVWLCVCRSVVAKAQLVCNMQTHTLTYPQNPLIGQQQNCFVCSVAEHVSLLLLLYKYASPNILIRTRIARHSFVFRNTVGSFTHNNTNYIECRIFGAFTIKRDES